MVSKRPQAPGVAPDLRKRSSVHAAGGPTPQATHSEFCFSSARPDAAYQPVEAPPHPKLRMERRTGCQAPSLSFYPYFSYRLKVNFCLSDLMMLCPSVMTITRSCPHLLSVLPVARFPPSHQQHWQTAGCSPKPALALLSNTTCKIPWQHDHLQGGQCSPGPLELAHGVALRSDYVLAHGLWWG